jgi:hypothetical protein
VGLVAKLIAWGTGLEHDPQKWMPVLRKRSCFPHVGTRFLVTLLQVGIIVLDQMDVEMLGRLAIDLLQEAQPFDVRVTRLRAPFAGSPANHSWRGSWSIFTGQDTHETPVSLYRERQTTNARRYAQ